MLDEYQGYFLKVKQLHRSAEFCIHAAYNSKTIRLYTLNPKRVNILTGIRTRVSIVKDIRGIWRGVMKLQEDSLSRGSRR